MKPSRCKRSAVTAVVTPQRVGLTVLAMSVLLTCFVAVSLAAPPLPVQIDPFSPEHRDLFEPVFGTPWTLTFDPDDTAAFYMGIQVADLPQDTFQDIRYVLLDYDNLENPDLYFESRGGIEGSGNPSHYVIFGWEDYKNYYYAYVPASTGTRISRVVNGVTQTLYRHGQVIWERDRDWYNSIRTRLHTVDGQRVLDTYVGGELVMSYTFLAGEEPPAGKVGIGMWNLTHSAYIKNIVLDDK